VGEVHVLDDGAAAQLGGLEDSLQSAVLSLQEFSIDEESESFLETEPGVVGVFSLLE
jgi:hypothetical protein